VHLVLIVAVRDSTPLALPAVEHLVQEREAPLPRLIHVSLALVLCFKPLTGMHMRCAARLPPAAPPHQFGVINTIENLRRLRAVELEVQQ
jgi:hypothetical protein